MLMTVDMSADRKPGPRANFASGRYSRGVFLNRLRDEIAILAAMGFDRSEIARAFRLSEDDVQALSPKTRKRTMQRNLTHRAVHALLHGRHAHLGGRTISSRAKRLVEIASAYTREELLAEPGIGTVTAAEIALWLKARGYSLADEGSSNAVNVAVNRSGKDNQAG